MFSVTVNWHTPFTIVILEHQRIAAHPRTAFRDHELRILGHQRLGVDGLLDASARSASAICPAYPPSRSSTSERCCKPSSHSLLAHVCSPGRATACQNASICVVAVSARRRNDLLPIGRE